jgi:hypothetical protein
VFSANLARLTSISTVFPSTLPWLGTWYFSGMRGWVPVLVLQVPRGGRGQDTEAHSPPPGRYVALPEIDVDGLVAGGIGVGDIRRDDLLTIASTPRRVAENHVFGCPDPTSGM